MYYLQSRYYDPTLGRFINADTFTTTDANGFLSCNMFAYCENNPVNQSDPSGEFGWDTVVSGIIGAVNGAVACYVAGGSLKDVGFAAAFGAVNAITKNSLIVKATIFAYTAITTYKSSGDISNSILAGGVAVAASFVSGHSVSSLVGNIGSFVEAAVDISIGFGASLSSSAMVASLSTRPPSAISSSPASKSTAARYRSYRRTQRRSNTRISAKRTNPRRLYL